MIALLFEISFGFCLLLTSIGLIKVREVGPFKMFAIAFQFEIVLLCCPALFC